MSRPLIVDTFPFFNEFDVLEMRLETMADVVDHFIAVEADITHQGESKPYHLSDNIDRFDRWKDKLIVVRATGMPSVADNPDPWSRELMQREYVLDGLRHIDGLTPDSILLHGDVDEICRPLHVRNVRPTFPKRPSALPDKTRDVGLVTFGQRGHFHAVDWLYPEVWCGTVAGTLQQVIELGPYPFRKMRITRTYNPTRLHDSGWHFSWLGGQKSTLTKLDAFCHPEVADRSRQGLSDDRYMREGLHVDGRVMSPVDVDDEWPAYIVERRCPTEWFRPR